MATTSDKAAPTASPAQVPTDPKRHIFPFMDLPRELRDECYDYMLDDEMEYRSENNLIVKAKNAAPLDLAVISHQFSSEFLDRMKKKPPELTISDVPHFGGGPMTLPRVASSYVQKLHINLDSFWHLYARHITWIPFLLDQLPCLTSLSIKVVVEYENEGNEAGQALVDLDEDEFPLTTLEKLDTLEIYIGYGISTSDFDMQHPLVVRWTAETQDFETFELETVESEDEEAESEEEENGLDKDVTGGDEVEGNQAGEQEENEVDSS